MMPVAKPDDKQRRRDGPLVFWWAIAALPCGLFWFAAVYLIF